MGTRLRHDVRKFHEKFGHPVRERPVIPPDEEVRFRLKLITEEYLEVVDAATSDDHPSAVLKDTFKKMIRHYLNEAKIDVDLPELMDGLGDLDFVSEGTRLVCGVDGAPVAAAIGHANLAKDPVYVAEKDEHHRRPDPLAKPTKPPGWLPPDVEGELRRQGWTVRR
jgi:predicted HAD superfamily Cof-like phosphohydrolase